MSASVKRISDRVVEIREGENVITLEGKELDRVADALALYADMCPCGESMCLGCEQSQGYWELHTNQESCPHQNDGTPQTDQENG